MRQLLSVTATKYMAGPISRGFISHEKNVTSILQLEYQFPLTEIPCSMLEKSKISSLSFWESKC